MIDFAIGALTLPPKPLSWFSSTTAPATTGFDRARRR